MSEDKNPFKGKELLDYFEKNNLQKPNKDELKELIRASKNMEILTDAVKGTWEKLHNKNNNPLNNTIYYDELLMGYYCVLNSKHDRTRQGILCFTYNKY